MAFWRRKNKDQYITLGLNEPSPAREKEQTQVTAERLEQPAAPTQADTMPRAAIPTLEPVITGDQPTPPPARESHSVTESERTSTPQAQTPVASSHEREPVKPASQQKPVASRSPFQTSVLGLNLTMEELQAQEAALEQEFSARFRRAISATRESLSETIDTVFQSRRKIDAALLDELEEALIAADIGVPTTLHILETVRRGIARNQINDIEALKQAIKTELLNILQASERGGVASELSVPETVAPYVMMIVGVNGVGKTTTIGKLARRIKAEGNDVFICAADTFRAAASDQLAI